MALSLITHLTRHFLKRSSYRLWELNVPGYRHSHFPLMSIELFRMFSSAVCLRSTEAKTTASEMHSQHGTGVGDEFRNIYTFRYIVHAKVVSRLKIYQTFTTVSLIPVGIYLHLAGSLQAPALWSFVGVASFATVMLFIMSTFIRHIVGIISVNKNEDVICISHLTFWGRRNNSYFYVSDIVPLSDMSVKADDICQVIQFYKDPVRYYWFLRHGKKTDAGAIERIFGKLS